MITLITDKDRIEINKDNPLHERLLPLAGKFVAVYLSEDTSEESPTEEPIKAKVRYSNYLEELISSFDEKSIVFKLLYSHLDRFLSRSGTINKSATSSRTKDGLSIRLGNEYLFVPEKYLIMEAS